MVISGPKGPLFEEEKVEKLKIIRCKDPKRFGYCTPMLAEDVLIAVDIISVCEKFCSKLCKTYKEEKGES